MEEAKEAIKTNNDFGNFHAKLELVPIAIPFFDGKHVKQLAGGYSFSAAVTENGELYTWGFNEVGQLGLGHRFNIHTPSRVTAFGNDETVVQIACGQQVNTGFVVLLNV